MQVLRKHISLITNENTAKYLEITIDSARFWKVHVNNDKNNTYEKKKVHVKLKDILDNVIFLFVSTLQAYVIKNKY